MGGDGVGRVSGEHLAAAQHHEPGARCRIPGDLTAGIAYDTNPVNSRNRVAQLPVDEQIRYNAGARYHLSDSLMVGGYLNYTDLGSAQIDGNFWSGDYSTNEMYQFAVFVNWAM